MGPKKTTIPPEDIENRWRKEIETFALNDETFSMMVVMIDGIGDELDKTYLNKFETMARQERRYVIRNVCKSETYFMVNQLGVGSDKKGKDENLRVFEEGYIYTKEKTDIPAQVMALIVKKLAIKMRVEYLIVKRQRLEVQAGLRQESATMLDKELVKGSVTANREPRPPSPEPASSAKSKKGQMPPPAEPETIYPEEGKKYNTVLRERGEEWRDKVYVADYPIDGPNAYLVITGFVDPFLAIELIKIGVPVSAVIQIRIDPNNVRQTTFFDNTKRRQSVDNGQVEKYFIFWETIQKVRLHPETAIFLKATAFIIFSPPYFASDETLSGDPEKIYDEISFLMYDIQDLTRQHLNYLDNMEVVHIPEYATADVTCINSYTDQISGIPLECITIYSVVDALLETISEMVKSDPQDTHDESSIVTTTTRRTATTLQSTATPTATGHSTSTRHTAPVGSTAANDKVKKAENFVTSVFTRLCQTAESQKAYRITYGEDFEEHKDPVIIKYGDYAKYITFHLSDTSSHKKVISILTGMPINRLWLHQERPELELEAKVNFHVNVLLSCFEREDVETAELDRLLHVLACRKLYNNRSSLKKKHLGPTSLEELKRTILKRSTLAEPLKSLRISISKSHSSPSFIRSSSGSAALITDNESEVDRIKFLFDCPDISELVSTSEIATNRPTANIIDDFEFFEDFTERNALQIMFDAFNKFNCVDYKYCEVTDCIILMFFNSHDKDGIAREEWCKHLPTPVCLQDFFDFILDEHYEWVKDQERIYDENNVIKEQSMMQDLFTAFSTTCIGDTDVESDLLIEGSLKHQALIIENSSRNTDADVSITTSPTTVASKKSSPKTLDKKSTPTTQKKRQLSFTGPLVEPSSSPTQLIRKPFVGYDLGDRRLEVIGKDSTFFSQDGTKVKSQYMLFVPSDDEYVILNIVPGNNECIEFWMHKVLGDLCSPEAAEAAEAFRVVTKDQMTINFKKQTYTLPQKCTGSEVNLPRLLKTSTMVVTPPLENKPDIIMPYHSLCVTWPNGLITESVHVDNSADVSHIKQTFVTNNPTIDEEMRCISMYGEVIIFKKSGIIEVLRPGGVCILITKYYKKINYIEPKSESDVTTKTKKNTPKEKTKTPLKEKPIPLSPEELGKLYGYILEIEEFEIIETSGLRQKWCGEQFENIEKLFIRSATDYMLGEVFTRRLDGTHSLLNKDGIQIVTFPNKTRIITEFVIDDEEIFPEWTHAEIENFEIEDIEWNLPNACPSANNGKDLDSTDSDNYDVSEKSDDEKHSIERQRQDGFVSVHIIYTVENSYFATVTINKQKGTVAINSPNGTCVTVDSNNHYDIVLDPATCANFDGKNLLINYEACSECKSFTRFDVNMRAKVGTESELELGDGPHLHWLRMKDSFNKQVVVNHEGNMSVVEDPAIIPTEQLGAGEPADLIRQHEAESPEDTKSDVKSEASTHATGECQGKCRQVDDGKRIRFMVLRRDQSCSELVHRGLIEQYKQTCRWLPWCSINQYDSFGDHRTIWSLLTPMYLTESEKWIMDSKMSDKPKHLAFKDLKPDTGKGFYHWMRPYERFTPKPVKIENALPPRLPRAFIMRTLEQQWKEHEREEFKGARELLLAILKYRELMAQDCASLLDIPIRDPRTEQERITDQIVQDIAHKVWCETKKKVKEETKTSLVPNITTKPAPPIPEAEDYITGEQEESECSAESSLVEELDQAVPLSPNLQRYWRRRAEERKQEEYCKYLLRSGGVPPYFLGNNEGAVWGEVNKVAGDAVTLSERRKTTCVCADKDGDDSTAGFTLLM